MSFGAFGREFKETALSLAPAIALVITFQLLFVRLPAAEFTPILIGLIATVFGFVLFIQGAKVGLLPLGQGIGTTFVERRAVALLLLFGLLLGVVLTVAEPDVRLLAFQFDETLGLDGTRLALIVTSAIGLGVFGLVALVRIAFDVPIHLILVPGYLIGLALMVLVPERIGSQAFDMGAVTTGPMTVPFLLALGVGIASVLGGRDRLKTGFGLMGVASIGPVLAIMLSHLLRGPS